MIKFSKKTLFNMSDFWIGDHVIVKSSGVKGIYRKDIDNHFAQIAIGDKLMRIKISDLQLLPDPTPELKPAGIPSKRIVNKATSPIPKTIDLHLEHLDPHGQINQNRMLDYQMEHCRKFINNAILAKYRTVLIIHGKGSGILKSSVWHYLEDHETVEFIFEKNNGGAAEVWLRW
jgi:dsDNA-specific endonuclease/ATPase MutS2